MWFYFYEGHASLQKIRQAKGYRYDIVLLDLREVVSLKLRKFIANRYYNYLISNYISKYISKY